MSVAEKSLVDQVVEKVAEKIVTREWEIGDRIPSEPKLAEQFHVSRNTIRSALSRLSAYGIVETRHGSGSYISRPIVSNDTLNISNFPKERIRKIIDMLLYRRALEPFAASLAAKSHSEPQLEEMESTLRAMIESEQDPIAYTKADAQFHLSVARASNNEYFFQALDQVQVPLINHFMEMNAGIGTEFSARDHQQLFQVIRQRREEEAYRLMYQLIDRSLNIYMIKSKFDL